MEETMTQEIPKMELTSLNVQEDQLAKLKAVFPEVFNEDKVDWDKLRRTLGEAIDSGDERYGMNWPGKSNCFRAIQESSVGTLKPCKEESINWDSTENIFIEGDNLEVLKLLQQAYYGKVKMIYIDPPYNTGNEFIYPDKYSESLETYLAFSGQLDDKGFKFTSNLETDGRFHSKWMNMMYPRLFLAKNLLKEDGAIFISIDDHEVQNLRVIMDEIFGSENFITTIIWQKVYSPKNSAKHFSEDHDYVVVYAKNAETWRPLLLPRTEDMEARYTNPDNDPRGPWKSGDLSARNYYGEGTYPLTCPSGRVIEGPPPGNYWRVSKAKFLELDADSRIWWGKDGNNTPAIKRFASEVKQGRVPQTLWTYQEVGHTQEAKKELISHVTFESSDSMFDTPKPTRLIERMLRLATSSSNGDIVLDFFAGSGSTGEAVLKLNREDNGNRRFILVQLPEPTGEQNFKTIADIAKQRLKSSIAKIQEADKEKLALNAEIANFGFRTFKLSSSSFKIWDSKLSSDGDVSKQIELFIEHIDPNSADDDILFEILSKAGFELTTKIETLELGGKKIYSIAGDVLLICLERKLTKEVITAMASRQPARVVCLDAGFDGNDQLKTNAVQIMKSHGVTDFKTV